MKDNDVEWKTVDNAGKADYKVVIKECEEYLESHFAEYLPRFKRKAPLSGKDKEKEKEKDKEKEPNVFASLSNAVLQQQLSDLVISARSPSFFINILYSSITAYLLGQC